MYLYKILKEIEQTLQKLPRCITLILCCSGGVDSMILTLSTFKLKLEDQRFKVLIINHNISRYASYNAELTKNRLIKNRIPGESIIIKDIDINTRRNDNSYENLARIKRYEIYKDLLRNNKNSYCLLAHNKNDQSECTLLGLLHGSGVKSIYGMKEIDGRYVRPLLNISREEIINTAKRLRLRYIVDPDNSNYKFERVSIRSKILPLLNTYLKKDIVKNLSRTATILQDTYTYLQMISYTVLQESHDVDKNILNISKLQYKNKIIITEVIYLYLSYYNYLYSYRVNNKIINSIYEKIIVSKKYKYNRNFYSITLKKNIFIEIDKKKEILKIINKNGII